MTGSPHVFGECGVGGCLFFCFGGGMGRRGALRMRCLVTCGFDSHLKHLGWLI